MRIMVLFGSEQFGGSFVIAEKVANKLREEGHDVLLVLRDSLMAEEYRKFGYLVHVVDTMRRNLDLVNDVRTIHTLRNIYLDGHYDIIHSHTSKGGFYSRILKMICPRIRVLHTVHGFYFPQKKIFKFIFLSVEKFLYNKCDGITFVNSEDLKLASTWKSHKCAMLIYNGVVVNDCEIRRTQNDVFKIVINARLVWEKGFKEVCYLVQKMVRHPIQFHIMGDGPDKNEILSYLEKSPNVIYHGFVKDVKSILQECDLNLLPSYREGLSLSILESMALGLPTVAYNIRGNRELVKNNVTGLLVTFGDYNALEEAILKYFKNNELRLSHGKEAKNTARQEFNINVMLDSYVNLILQICKS